MEHVIVNTTHGNSRGYSRVALCKRRLGCCREGSHFHVENYSSASARSPFSQSGPFTCCDDAFDEIQEAPCATREQQMQAVLDAMNAGTLPLKEDDLDRIFNEPENGFMVAEGLETLNSVDELSMMEKLYDAVPVADMSAATEELSDVVMPYDDDDFPEIIIEEPLSPVRRRSAQPPIIVSGEISAS